MTNKKTPKNAEKFNCNFCDFICSKQSDYNRHITTRKHKILTNTNKKTPKNAKAYMCSCGKSYKHASSLSGHKKKCNFLKEIEYKIIENEKNDNEEEEYEEKEQQQEDNEENKLMTKDEMITKLIDANKELQNLLIDQQKQMGELIPKVGNTNYNNYNNTNYNNFNLNVFLNEDCKDALNLTDFVSSLQIQMKDLDATGKMGFAESASQLFIKELSQLDVNKRPIHCSDLKRETLYIKDNDVWEKENEDKDKMTKAVKYIQKETFNAIPDWVKEHPGCARGDNINNELYMDIVGNTAGVDKIKDVNKIIKKVAKEVVIDKKKF